MKKRNFRAAWTTAAAYFAMMAGAFFHSERIYPIPYEYGRWTLLVAVALGLALAAASLPDWGWVGHHASRLAALAVYVVLLLKLRVIRRAELAGLLRRTSHVPEAGPNAAARPVTGAPSVP